MLPISSLRLPRDTYSQWLTSTGLLSTWRGPTVEDKEAEQEWPMLICHSLVPVAFKDWHAQKQHVRTDSLWTECYLVVKEHCSLHYPHKTQVHIPWNTKSVYLLHCSMTIMWCSIMYNPQRIDQKQHLKTLLDNRARWFNNSRYKSWSVDRLV